MKKIVLLGVLGLATLPASAQDAAGLCYYDDSAYSPNAPINVGGKWLECLNDADNGLHWSDVKPPEGVCAFNGADHDIGTVLPVRVGAMMGAQQLVCTEHGWQF